MLSVSLLADQIRFPPGEPPQSSPSALSLPPATVSYHSMKLQSFWTLTPAWMYKPRGPTKRSRIPAFRAEGRISFSVCLAGKYVTGLEADPAKNRWNVFKAATRAWVMCFFTHTLKGNEGQSPACRGVVCQEALSLQGFIWDRLLNLLKLDSLHRVYQYNKKIYISQNHRLVVTKMKRQWPFKWLNELWQGGALLEGTTDSASLLSHLPGGGKTCYSLL